MNRTRRAKGEPVEDDVDIAIVFETTPSQLPGSEPLDEEDEVVSDSQGEESDDNENKPMDLDAVNSQMNFFPMFTSTQRTEGPAKRAPKAIAPPEKETTVIKDRKRKKTSALTDRPVKKTLTSTTMATERTFNFTGPSVPKTRKTSSLEDLPSKKVRTSVSMDTTELKPSVKTQSSKESKEESHEQSNGSKVKPIDVSLVSSGKKYAVEESHSFLSQPHSGRSMFSENDIDQVVANMKDLVEVIVLTRQSPPSALSVETCSQNNFKKFKKAAQGRYNPHLASCRGVMIGEEDFRDWISFCD